MDIIEMHTLFRTIGQQKGLQQVRAILPDEIDVYLNTAIVEKCRSLVMTNTSTTFQDRITVEQNPISPINALKSLITVEELSRSTTSVNGDCYIFYSSDLNNNPMFYTSFYTKYDVANIDGSVGVEQYQCRLLEYDKLFSTLHDYCNAPDKEYPTTVVRDNGGYNEILVYTNDAVAPILGVVYLRYPVKVSYVGSISCDLPDYLHSEIVEIAVNKFFQSVGNTTKQVQ